MKYTSAALVLMLTVFAWGQSADKTFHHCTYTFGGAVNSPHLYDVSEIYKCDEGVIEISGTWDEVIENGWVYTSNLGKPSLLPPHEATKDDYEGAQWCPSDPNHMKRCGDKPRKCWDGKMATWNPDWQGYSCATPDHK